MAAIDGPLEGGVQPIPPSSCRVGSTPTLTQALHPRTFQVEASRILIVGDLHGNTAAALVVVEQAAALSAHIIVQCGDFGYWGGPNGDAFQRKLARRLEQHRLRLVWVDGNHEAHTKLNAQPLNADGTHWYWTGREWSPTIRHLPRGYRWTWAGTQWLAAGGAYSVDKKLRTAGLDWFAEEQLTDDEVDAIVAEGPAEVLVSHDAPLGVPFLRRRLRQDLPAWRRESPWGTGAIVRSDEHMRRIRRLVDGVRATRVFHGHHHVRYEDRLQSSHGLVVVNGLGMDRDSIGDLALLVGPDGRPIAQEGNPVDS